MLLRGNESSETFYDLGNFTYRISFELSTSQPALLKSVLMLSSYSLRSFENEHSLQRFYNTLPCITYLSIVQITTVSLNK
jgi:hypothetical protein